MTDALVSEYIEERRLATEAALNLCPEWIKRWLVGTTSQGGDEALSYSESMEDDVEWFEVGRNASHYFSLGVRSDGVFIKKVSGDEFHQECQCWYFKTSLKIVSLEEIERGYWGHL